MGCWVFTALMAERSLGGRVWVVVFLAYDVIGLEVYAMTYFTYVRLGCRVFAGLDGTVVAG